MNRVCAIGRLTKDPTISYAGELAVARFILAVPRPKTKDKDATTDFPTCVAFGKTAETIERYLSKGRLIGIEGRIQTGNYTDKDDKKVYTTDIVVERVEFLERKQESKETESQASMIPEGFEALDEDIPF